MFAALRSVLSLLLGFTFLSLGSGLISILLPLRLGIEEISSQTAGLVMSAYYAGFMGGSIYGQRIIQRVGHIRAFAAFAALVTAAVMVHALIFNPFLWAVLRALFGACMAGLYAVIESWLNVKASNELRGRVLSLYTATSYLSSGVGQLFVNIQPPQGIELFCLGAFLTSISLVPIVLTRVAGPEIGRIKPLSVQALYRASPLGVVTTAGAGLLTGALYGLGAIFAGQIGLSVWQTSIFIGAPILGGFVLQWPIGRLSDRLDRRTVLLTVLLATIGALVLLMSLAGNPDNAIVQIVNMFLLGGLLATIYPIAVAQTFDYIDSSQMVAANSGMLLAWASGATAGPLIASFAMGQLGPHGLFIYMTAVAVTLATFTGWRMVRRMARPAEEQAAFVPVSATTAIAGALDPRAEPLPEFYYEDADPGDR